MSNHGSNRGKPGSASFTNPYAKKRKAEASGSSGPPAPSRRAAAASSSNHSRRGPAELSADALSRAGNAGLGASTWTGTFSQEFESIDTSAHFARSAPSRSSYRSGADRSDRGGGANIGAATAGPSGAGVANTANGNIRNSSSNSSSSSSSTPTNDNNGGASGGGITSNRDHHVLLQPHVLYVSTKQRGNGVLQHIRNVPYAFTKMVPDFIMSTTQCALFLSVKYHQLYPNYIHRRLGELKSDFMLRILLVLVDVEDNVNALRFLNKLAVTHNLTLMLSWTEAEAARYLETYKALDGTDATSIQRREQNNFVDQVSEFLTASNPCNKTDSGQLLSHFRTVQSVVAASQDELATCPGLGAVKVRKLWDAFHQPFSSKQAAARQKKASDAVGGGTNRNGDSTTNANP